MASCDYYVLQSIYEAIDEKLGNVASKIDELDLDVKIDELDIDLDNLEAQLKIANKLKLLDAIGTDIMTESAQQAAYETLVDELFSSATISGDSMTEEDGEF